MKFRTEINTKNPMIDRMVGSFINANYIAYGKDGDLSVIALQPSGTEGVESAVEDGRAHVGY